MKKDQKTEKVQKLKKRQVPQKEHILLMIIGGIAFFALLINALLPIGKSQNMVMATEHEDATDALGSQPGLAALMDSVTEMEAFYRRGQMAPVNAPGEQILAGARAVNRGMMVQNAFSRYARRANELGYEAQQVVADNQLPYQEYYTLLQIVEAEATGGDEKSKLLIANVVQNRVADEHFPNTISEVVWQNVDGFPQFSPTADGRMGNLSITESTRQAVKRALEGENIAQGALFFVARSSATGSNLKWFDDSLVYLYEYGGHAFYRFPTPQEQEKMAEVSSEPEESASEADT